MGFRRRFLYRDILNACMPWPLPQPLFQAFERCFLTTGNYLHATIGKIAHPTRQPQIVRRVLRGRPEEHTLNLTRNQKSLTAAHVRGCRYPFFDA